MYSAVRKFGTTSPKLVQNGKFRYSQACLRHFVQHRLTKAVLDYYPTFCEHILLQPVCLT
jgi:hypothetical protein